MSEEEQIILPDGYTKLEWIGNFVTTNTATNCKIILPLNFDFFKDGTGDSSLIFETEHAFTSLVHDQAEGISYGSITQANNEEFFWLLYNNYIGTHAGEFISFTNLKPQIDEFIKIKLIWTPNLVTFEVTYKGETYSNSKVPTSKWSCTEIGLFHKLLGEKSQVSHRALSGKKKYCKIWKNGELLYNLIPCLDNENVACMFDLVSQQSFYNQGTGRFLTNKDFEIGYTSYNLPSGFKKCVYLQSDGTQWINTQVVPNAETGLYLRALRLNYGPYVSFGVNEGGNEMYPPRFDNGSLNFRWGTSITKMMTWDKAGDFNFSSYLNFYNSKIAKFNSDDTDAYSQITSSIKTFTIPIWLFTYNYNGSYNATYGKWGGRIYRAQITQGDALIRDFVPCLDADNRPCMYDLITQEAYYNQSGGTEFSYCVEHELPSDFVKLKYLESDGTQFIKTGYVPTNTTGLYIDAYNTNLITSSVLPMGMRETNGNTYFTAPRTAKGSEAGFGWGTFTSPNGRGDVRYEGTLNWLNDRKAILSSPAFAQKVNSLSTLSFTPLKDIYIFGIHNYDGKYLAGSWRIYRAKISEGSEVVRDWVPAIDSRNYKPCLYDLINNVAYYNDGTGEFLYNRDFEGTYKGYTGLGCIGKRLGSDCNPINEKLPSGYTKVEFLEANKLQYINTNIPPTGDMKITVDVLSTRWNYVNYVFGSSQKSGSNIVFSMNYNYGNSTAGLYRYGTQFKYFRYGTHKLDTRYHYVFDGSIVYRNGVKATFIDSKDFTPEEFEGTASLLLFISRHDNGGLYDEGTKRIWKFIIERQGYKLLDFIPAIDTNGNPCMFDLVTQQPFYNVGEGRFVVGLKSISHALQLRLPESGGTIDLSLPTNDNTEYYESKIRANNPNWEITFYYH